MRRRAVVLAGGLGSRLRPYTTIVPKPLMPLGDRPILEILLLQLARQGFERVDLCVGHLAHLIRAYFGDGARVGLEIAYHDEDEPLGTIGPAAAIDGIAQEPAVLVLNGDILTDLDFASVLDAHAVSGNAATVCAVRRRVDIDFGVLDVADDGTLAAYREKPALEVVVSIGVNAVSGAALATLARGERLDAPQFMLRLKDAGERVGCRITEGFWLDLGRIDDYRAAAELVERDPDRFLPG